MYLARAIQGFVMYYINGTSRSSLLIESTDSMIYIFFTVAVNTYVPIFWGLDTCGGRKYTHTYTHTGQLQYRGLIIKLYIYILLHSSRGVGIN